MNYLKIYNNLIESRKYFSYPHGTYVEKHHIIPRHHGGQDSEDNLITLSARDHFMAHLLLARHYGGTAWVACWAMTMKTSKSTREGLKINSRTYALIRSKWAETNWGPTHPNTDNNIYTFFDMITKEEFQATRWDVQIKYNISCAQLSKLLAETNRTAACLTLPHNKHLKLVESNNIVYSLKKLSDDSIIEATRKTMQERLGFSYNQMRILCSGTSKKSNGYSIVSKRYDKDF